MPKDPVFFESPAAFRAWLKKHHRTERELFVGYLKVHVVRAGRPSITYQESVKEALCFGWIDGLKGAIDGESYTIRFTPRLATSKWSAVNIRLIGELEAAGKMTDAGRAVFHGRKNPHLPGYTSQKRVGKLDRRRAAAFRKHKAAWKFFQAQPPGYRKTAMWWVMQAKKEETRDRRLEKLIRVSGEGRRVV